MATTAKQARDQHKRSKRGHKRRDDPRNYWHRSANPYVVGKERWRFTALGIAGKRRKISLSKESTSASWTWESATLTGQLTAQVTEGKPNILEGEEIACHVSRTRKGWRKVWKMIVQSVSTAYSDGSFSYELADENTRARRGRADYSFKASKDHHPHGWFAHEIAESVAHQNKIPIGKLTKGHHRIKKLTMMNASPLAVIAKAYKEDRETSGRRFIIDLHDGQLNVYTLRPSKRLLRLAGLMLDANTVKTLNNKLATVVTARATANKKNGDNKKDKRKLVVTMRSKRLVKRYGYIHTQIEVDTDSEDVLRRRARRYLIEHGKPKRELTLTMPGVWQLRRGDAIRVKLPEKALKNQIVFVRNVTHNVSPGDYSMEVTLRFTDPVEDARKERAQAKKCKKARERDRRPPKDCPKVKGDKPKPDRNHNRQDQHK